MENIKYANFCKIICEDYKISHLQKIQINYDDFPIINGKKKINRPGNSIIVDHEDNEYPYMITSFMRNEAKLVSFKHIYTVVPKTLLKIIKELDIVLENKPCKICEGGGWYTNGTKYTYKNFTCED